MAVLRTALISLGREALVAAPVAVGFPLGPGVEVVPPSEALSRLE